MQAYSLNVIEVILNRFITLPLGRFPAEVHQDIGLAGRYGVLGFALINKLLQVDGVHLVNDVLNVIAGGNKDLESEKKTNGIQVVGSRKELKDEFSGSCLKGNELLKNSV